MGLKPHLVPKDFDVPGGFETPDMKIRMLKISDVVKDYDAVMSSIDHLKGIFGRRSDWPSPDLTLEQDLIDLGWHQKEFQIRSSFAYTIMSSDESQCLGCVYIYPCSKVGHDAEIYFWVRKSAFDGGLDQTVQDSVMQWIDSEWPFKSPAYPGRTQSWQEWERLP